MDDGEELSLIDEGLHSLRGVLDSHTRLRVINAHSNHLTRVADAELGAFPSLRELNLSSNDLSTLDGVQGLATLEVLNVSSNRLVAIDVPVLGMASLRSLNLSYNRISSLAPLGELGRTAADHPLASLQLQGNQVQDLSEAAQLRHFRHLGEVVFRRDSTANPLCSLPGYPSAVLRDGLPACVQRLDGVAVEELAREPPAPTAAMPVTEPMTAAAPPPVQGSAPLQSPPPSPWVSVAPHDGTPPKGAVATQNATPHIDAALNTFKSRHDGSRRASDPGTVQSAQAVAEAAAAATSKRMLYALDQELRLEKLETNLARIVAAGVDASGAPDSRTGDDLSDPPRKPYRPRLSADPGQPGLGRNLQRPVAHGRRGHSDVSSLLSEDFGSSAGSELTEDQQLLSSSEGSKHFDGHAGIFDEGGDRDASEDDGEGSEDPHNPWGSKRNPRRRKGDPSWDKENFAAAESTADAAYWSGIDEEADSELDVGASRDGALDSVDASSVDTADVVGGNGSPTSRAKLTQQQSRLLTPRRRNKGKGKGVRNHQAQHSTGSNADLAQVHGEDREQPSKRADASKGSHRPAETTIVGAPTGSVSESRRPMSKARQRELEEAYAREQEQVKQLMHKLEALEAGVAEHETRQQSETKALQEELETERLLRAEVQALRLAATSDKEKAEAAAKDALEKFSGSEVAQQTAAAALAEVQQMLKETEKRVEEKEQRLKKQADDLDTSHQMEAALAGKLKSLQATLHGLEEEWAAREAAADAVLSGLKADFERAKSAAERAEQARVDAQAQADTTARTIQEVKRQTGELTERHNEVTGKLELDIEAYRRSESMLQQKLNELGVELTTEKQRHAELSEEQSSMHAAQVRNLMAEVAEHQKQQSAENNEQLVAQRQLMLLEEQGIEQKKAALRRQQELELGMMQASNKVRELKELLRVSITKEARSASSSRELSLCVKALREKLLDRDDECTSLQKALEQAETASEDQTSRHELALSALEVKLTTARYRMPHSRIALHALPSC